MTEIKVTITGLKELQEAALKMPVVAANEIGKATTASLQTLQQNAMHEAPVNKGPGGGTLHQRIFKRMVNRFSGYIIADTNYAAAVEEGTVPHIIRPKGNWGLRNSRTGQYFGRIVHHPGTKANPFMERAIKSSIDKIQEHISNALQNILKTIK